MGLEKSARAWINLQRKTIHMLRRLLDESDTTSTWGIDFNSHGSNTAPALLRAEYPTAVAKLRDVMKEAVAAGHVFNSHIPVDVQFRQRRRQQFERSEEAHADHANTEELRTASTGTPVACSVKQGSSWEGWWSSSDSWRYRWQDWHSS